MNRAEQQVFSAWAKTQKHREKVTSALEIIQGTLELVQSPEQLVAISWGKDSVVMLHLVQRIIPDVRAVFAGGYWMETYDNFLQVQQQYCDKFPTNLTYLEQSREDALTPRKAPPAKTMMDPLNAHLTYLGLRKEESKVRRMSLIKYGPIHQYTNGRYRVCPVHNWSSLDIWAYIAAYQLPHLKSYDTVEKLGKDARTTPHVTPLPAKTTLGAKVKGHLAFISPEFRTLMNGGFDGS